MANNNANNNNNVPNPNNNLPPRSIDPRSITINNAYERRQEGRGPVASNQQQQQLPQQLPQQQYPRAVSRNEPAPNAEQQPQHVSLFNHNNNGNAVAAAAATATPATPTQNGRTLTPTPSANIGGYAATANVRNWATTNGNMSFGEGEYTPSSAANTAAVVSTPSSASAIPPALSYSMVMDDDAAIMAGCGGGGGGGDDGKGIPLKIRPPSLHSVREINDMRANKQLCDAKIDVDDGSFYVHRPILSSCSRYFRALFTSPLPETYRQVGEHKVVRLQGIEADVFQALLDYCYVRDCDINADSVQDVLIASDRFGIIGLMNRCVEFMLNHLDFTNFLSLFRFARALQNTELIYRTYFWMLRKFKALTVAENSQFLDMNADELLGFISDDFLNAKSEEIVWEGLLRWVEHNNAERIQFMPNFLPFVRLGLMNSDYFVEHVKTHPYVAVESQDEGARAMKRTIIETLKLLYDLELAPKDKVPALARPRLPPQILIATGGWSGGAPTNVMECYDVRADQWFRTNAGDPAGPRAYHGLAVLHNQIYCIGGFDGQSHFNSVRVFSLKTREWREAAPMNCKRCYVSVCVLDNMIYAMGGFDSQVRQNTVERYDPKQNQWLFVARMHYQRSDACTAVLDRKIYICGGFNGQECLQTCEVFDADKNEWNHVAPMRSRRSGVGVAALGDHIYAIGGFNGISRMLSGEKYNPQTNQWTVISDMFNPRSNFSIDVLDGMIFVVGGFNGVTTIYNCECYDETTGEWIEVADMNLFRSALANCVVDIDVDLLDLIGRKRRKPLDVTRALQRPLITGSDEDMMMADSSSSNNNMTAITTSSANGSTPASWMTEAEVIARGQQPFNRHQHQVNPLQQYMGTGTRPNDTAP